VCILNVIYSLSCWTHHLIIYHFQAYSLIAGHFVGPSEPALWLYFVHFPLCLVSAPKLWTYINSCIKTIQLYYEVDFVINAALNSDWVRISLCVRLGSHRYGTLEGNLAYVPVMDPGFGSWHVLYRKLFKISRLQLRSWNGHMHNLNFLTLLSSWASWRKSSSDLEQSNYCLYFPR
jgi:hypothetical protein